MAEEDPNSAASDSAEEMEQTVHHRSHRQKREVNAAKMQLNLTSMIDVIFLLLIYFVVTASFQINEAILVTNMEHGGDSPNPLEMDTPLDIYLESVGGPKDAGVNIKVGQQQVHTFTQLFEVLKSKDYFAQDDPVKVHPGARVRWQHVVNAFNAAVKAEYTNVALLPPGQ